MATFTYIGDPRAKDDSDPRASRRYTDQTSVTLYGVTFTFAQEVQLNDEKNAVLIAKLRGNKHFMEKPKGVLSALKGPAKVAETEKTEDPRGALISEGKALGLRLNKRMSADTMRARIEKAKASDDDNEG